jgi:hypothetical protein
LQSTQPPSPGKSHDRPSMAINVPVPFFIFVVVGRPKPGGA